MPCEVKPRLVVLYGSQKGQAQSIAEGIAEEAEEHGLVADLCCLNQNEKVNASNDLLHNLEQKKDSLKKSWLLCRNSTN